MQPTHRLPWHALTLFVMALLDVVSPVASVARDLVPGPVEARVVRVVDGDTLAVVARVWPGHEVSVKVRIRGIDAPEKSARCPRERELALSAQRRLENLVHRGPVYLSNISGGKYWGRVLADVRTPEGESVEFVLLSSGLVARYERRRKTSWCATG
ncbi:MAG: thermonuclease family protein [Pseudomonadota bacterium]